MPSRPGRLDLGEDDGVLQNLRAIEFFWYDHAPEVATFGVSSRTLADSSARAPDTVRGMSAELLAQIEPVGEATAPGDGWRGLIDFGEIWSEADTDLAWPPGSGNVPVGEPLVYSCEVTRADADTERVRVRFIALDSLRAVMVPGARFTLRDGATSRATGCVT